jgi:ADP-heptose:LPS heptosyltransferase
VVAAAEGAAALAPPTESLAELLALMTRARLFIGCDSGPMHLASLAGTPVVAIFGPTDPVENAPSQSVPSRIVRRDVGCNPCREGCPARECMRAVEPEAVVEAALALLERPDRGI